MSHDEESLDDVIRVSLWREAEFGEQPQQGLEAIRARIRAGDRDGEDGPRRPWLRMTVGAAVIGTAATIGVFTMLPGAVRPGVVEQVPEAAGPVVRGEAQPSRGATKPVARGFSVYWLGYQPGSKVPRLYRTVESFTGLVAVQAVRRLTGRVPDPDYFSGWTGAKVSSVSETNGVIVVDFTSLPKASQTSQDSRTPRASLLSGDDWLSDAALQQLVYTVQGASAQQLPVRITLQGKAVGVRSGSMDTKALPAAKILAPVWITSPTENATIATRSVKVTGLAMTFEGNVTYRIWNTRTGKTVDQNAATVLSGDDPAALRPFEFTVRLPPGDYLIECTEYSAHDGTLTTRDTKSFTVR